MDPLPARLDLDFKAHVGGLAYDSNSKNIWVCSTRDKSKKNTIGRFSYSKLKQFAKNKKPYEKLKLDKEYPVKYQSFITYYDKKIWVGSFAKEGNGKLISYEFNKSTNKLEQVGEEISIPAKTQGVDFVAKNKLLISTSYGRKNKSNLYLYKKSGSSLKQEKKWEMPPMSEDIDINGGRVYIVFESAANLYRNGADKNGKCKSPIDRVVSISTKKIK